MPFSWPLWSLWRSLRTSVFHPHITFYELFVKHSWKAKYLHYFLHRGKLKVAPKLRFLLPQKVFLNTVSHTSSCMHFFFNVRYPSRMKIIFFEKMLEAKFTICYINVYIKISNIHKVKMFFDIWKKKKQSRDIPPPHAWEFSWKIRPYFQSSAGRLLAYVQIMIVSK